MTISLSVAWALFTLAPGLAVFAGLFISKGRDVVHPAAPAPTSLISLAIVVFGALGLHALGGATFALNDWLATLPCFGWKVPWTPNVYAYFLSSSAKPESVGIEAFFLLAVLCCLSGLGFILTTITARRFDAGSTVHAFLYGWLSPILGLLKQEKGFTKHLIGYVVTDLETEHGFVGYEGQVVNLALNAEKQIISITLTNCQSFLLSSADNHLAHKSIARTNPIPTLQIDQSHIGNVALSVALVPTDAATIIGALDVPVQNSTA